MFKEYSYIWDGSDPTWRIERNYQFKYTIKITFSANGPTKEEKLAVLKLSDNFNSIGQVHKALNNKDSYVLGEFGSVNIKNIESECTNESLNFEVINNSDTISLLINSEYALLIEDIDLNDQLCKYAESKGVKVIEITD